ncbi:MAG TPA: 2-hydroxyacid dehydrogenase [Xanthobacteraceae bacterium]|nr:2-hydroxyacid dehydrogenase [Xanthobacteraceae bacterium]
MPDQRTEVLLVGPSRPVIARGLAGFAVPSLPAADRDASLAAVSHVGAMAVTAMIPVDDALLARLPKLEIIASFGVGYDHIDVTAAARRGVVVTNTPDVLTEEVADTALGLLLCTVREFPQAERYLRAGKWLEGNYPLSRATLRNRTVGLVGMGRIGTAIARRLQAFGVPVVYHARRPRHEVPYRHYSNLIEMARAVDVLMVIVPGGAATQAMINADVFEALGPEGILINIARGSVVDEPALVEALRERKIMAAGLDVFVNEPEVPAELLTMDNVVLFPHLGSASVFTREQMDQLVVDNILAWAARRPPLTPVAETPWRSWR